jgi:hypothetical protein
MFSNSSNDNKITETTILKKSTNKTNYYNTNTEISHEDIDRILESETLHNKSESWNKLNKTLKIQKLYGYTEKHGKEKGYSETEIQKLKQFFIESLERGKLQKTKEVVYDKNTQEIVDIPGLFYNSTNRHFTLRILDAKRISTLKSLTPKRISEKNKHKICISSENNEL